MNIQEVRLELVKLAFEKGLSPGAIPEFVEPLAEYVMSDFKAPLTFELKDFEQKYVADLLKRLQQLFGERKISAVEIGRNGALSIYVSCRQVSIGVREFLADSKNYPDFFRGRELIFFDVPPKKP
ncbi:hypothetical protein [Acinetobacter nosocomialis]|uniref:hypothetical protein n=1 Tax=Acinetobacter nosocomialis TaxID=106654 RepID=UPI00237EAC52|nr:hypothetical protein [Acinetobacter nosocomialis]MDE3320736.1 hypothetical protein [Acinetobacter nosocomialis]